MKHRPALLAGLLAVLPLAGHADVSLPRIFGNHMVLQRETPLKVWGTADAGEKISLELGPRSFSTTSDENGDWHIDLPPLKADGGKSHKGFYDACAANGIWVIAHCMASPGTAMGTRWLPWIL